MWKKKKKNTKERWALRISHESGQILKQNANVQKFLEITVSTTPQVHKSLNVKKSSLVLVSIQFHNIIYK